MTTWSSANLSSFMAMPGPDALLKSPIASALVAVAHETDAFAAGGDGGDDADEKHHSGHCKHTRTRTCMGARRISPGGVG